MRRIRFICDYGTFSMTRLGLFIICLITRQGRRCGGIALLILLYLVAPAIAQVEYRLSDSIEDVGADALEPISWLGSSLSSLEASGECYGQCEQGGCGCGHHHESRFRLTEFNVYPTFSYLDTAVGNYTEFEFASHTDLGWLEMENRTVLNVADLPGTIKLGAANPGDDPATLNVRGNGFGDVLSGFFFTCKCKDRNYHLGIGPVITFPTASNDLLGSNQWTIGPGAHFSTEIGKLTAGFFVWQFLWKRVAAGRCPGVHSAHTAVARIVPAS